MKFFFLLLILFFCSPQQESNLNVESFEGIDLEGKPVALKNISAQRIAINVYSPTCVPCVKELSALNYIQSRIENRPELKLFMVVDPYNITELPETASFEEAYQKSKAIMIQEKLDKKIQIPIIIMKQPFKVEPKTGLITGTPETLIFKMKPFVLYYNFIGSIAEKTTKEELEKDARLQFFLKQFGGT